MFNWSPCNITQADPKKQKGVKMQGFLNRKKDQKDKWKSQYFVLKQEGADTHMYIYEHPKRTKPKGLIDLSCAYLYRQLTKLGQTSVTDRGVY